VPPRERLPSLSIGEARAPSEGPAVWRTIGGGLLDEQQALEVLTEGELTVRGRLVGASNATLYGVLECGSWTAACVYKPTAGERPLWDFPGGTLAGREVAAYRVSAAGEFGVVPPTVLRDGPLGVGSVQLWVEPEPGETQHDHTADDHGVEVVTAGESTAGLVDVVPRDAVPEGWASVLDAYGPDDEPLALVHALDPRLATTATFDVLVNNADRKAGHLLAAPGDRVVGVDHGLTFHVDPKLRTVLWGFAGEAVAARDLARLDTLATWVTSPRGEQELDGLVSARELDVLARRVRRLIARPRMPLPEPGRTAIPWPPF
jgi:uncharacterized repeat protein (TIGR03843 family)